MKHPRELSRYVGIDYKKKNCFGLAKWFYREEMGEDLKEYAPPQGDISAEDSGALVATHKGDFKRVEVPIWGDLVILKLGHLPRHLAIFIGDGRILHTLPNKNSVIEPIYRYINMVEGFYRSQGK